MFCWKYVSLVAFVSFTISSTIGSNATNIDKPSQNTENETSYSSFYKEESSGLSVSSFGTSSFFFNDSADRLIQFDVTTKNNIMTLIIRQNMNVVWHKSYPVKAHRFFVKRVNSNGIVSFEIIMGEHTLCGCINGNDKWIVTEIKAPISTEKDMV